MKIITGLSVLLAGLFVVAGFSLLTGWIVSLMWNWLVPVLIKSAVITPHITYLQGWGIAFLSGMLFKSYSFSK
jgi:hypothetical protein